MGIDLGTRRIGLAVTDSAGTMALPRATVVRTGDAEFDRRQLVELVLEERIAVVVVGLPVSLDGSCGPAAAAATEEADSLRALLEGQVVDGRPVEVVVFDERLTTVSAHRALAEAGAGGRRRRRIVDEAAAAVMLSAWLDSAGGHR